ncbi:hypothetical protein SAMN05192553_10310 [Cyclobacterium xiamenense]|uniref:Uncharacterized protein n=1 Tax=Cyclobacterium xiamenense TaxID=1297121 RepID=A0A1H6XTG5_9BACT|nr:hypothetical protein [Cyclobacterium xiamenense]SEJ28182.1 hypothetical protein SAMN05192553_10310 [Cyclobacterium xiamenense]
METLFASLTILTFLTGLAVVLGFIRPVWVLWFLHRSNRLLVLKYYGIAFLLLLFTWLLLENVRY